MLTKKEIATLMRLLGLLKGHLESCIESHTLSDGSIDPRDELAMNNVPIDRADWKAAEQMVKRLEILSRV